MEATIRTFGRTGILSWIFTHGDGAAHDFMERSGRVFLLVVSSAALGILTQLVLTRSLGATEYGRYSVAIGWGLAIAAPAMAGLDASIVRFASRYYADCEGMRLRYFTVFMSALQLIVVTLAVGLVLLTPIRKLATSGFNGGVLWLALFIGSTAFLGSFAAFFVAFRKLSFSQIYQNFVRPFLLIGGVLTGVLIAGTRVTADFALAATAITSALALLLLIGHLLWLLRQIGVQGKGELDARRWLAFAGWAQLGSIAQLSAAQLPIIFLGALSAPAQAGYFAIAARVSSLVTFGLSAVGIASAPLISSAHSRADWGMIAQLTRLAARLATAIALVASLFFIVAGSRLMAIFGREFSQAYVPLLVLLAGSVFNAFSGVNVILLSMIDRPGSAVVALLVGALGIAVASYTLIPLLGALGGAIGMSVGTVVSNALMVITIRRTTGIDSTAIGMRPNWTFLRS
jgi:O-antigen/teichoic acid export membrane protein